MVTAMDEITYRYDDLPIEVPCPVCGTTGLKIETQITTSADVPLDGGLTIGGRARPTQYRLIPCEHLLSTWRWGRETSDSPVVWTLVPLL